MNLVVNLRKQIEILAPPHRVFELLAHPEEAPRWEPGLREARLDPDGPLQEGRGFTAVTEAFGGSYTWRAVATRVDPARTLAWHMVEGEFERHDARFQLEPTARGTRLHLAMDVEPPFVLPEFRTQEEVEEELSRRYDRALLNLKDLLEDAAGHATTLDLAGTA